MHRAGQRLYVRLQAPFLQSAILLQLIVLRRKLVISLPQWRVVEGGRLNPFICREVTTEH